MPRTWRDCGMRFSTSMFSASFNGPTWFFWFTCFKIRIQISLDFQISWSAKYWPKILTYFPYIAHQTKMWGHVYDYFTRPPANRFSRSKNSTNCSIRLQEPVVKHILLPNPSSNLFAYISDLEDAETDSSMTFHLSIHSHTHIYIYIYMCVCVNVLKTSIHAVHL